MVNMTLLQLFVLTVMLVSAAQIYLVVRYLLWPRVQRITHCPWCWRDAGIARDFPAPWTSTVCSFHDRLIRAQARASRLTRQVSSTPITKPAAVVLQPQAEEVPV